MKALTLWQPWASLVAIGAKQYETRHWFTMYRGDLVIHAAQRFGRREAALALQSPFAEVLGAAGLRPEWLPLGAGLCVVELADVLPVEEIVYNLSDQELAFGLYVPGHFAWQLKHVRRFDKPIPARGQQGLWDWEAATAEPRQLALF